MCDFYPSIYKPLNLPTREYVVDPWSCERLSG